MDEAGFRRFMTLWDRHQPVPVLCTHCGQDQRGRSSVTVGAEQYELCHPDTGMDCYRLVTVYRHAVVNCLCAVDDASMPPG